MMRTRRTVLLALVIIEFLIIFGFLGHHKRNMEAKRCAGHSWDSNISSTTATNAGAWMGVADIFQETSIPRVVYQVLNSKTLTFRNYLSILSVHKVLRPYRIILYVPVKFQPKPLEYNMWFQKVVDMIPYLEVKRYSDEINISTGVGELHLLSTDLNKMGGVYVNLDTIMLLNVWNSNQIGIADAATVPVIGFVAVNKFFNLTNLVQKIIEVGDIRKINITASTSCVLSRAFKGHEQCCLIQDNLHPINIMRDKSPFASFTRFLYYGTSKILEPRRSFQPIPKIVHYTWFGGGSMTYDMYLSFQSTLRFVKPTQIIIYVDSYDLGSYFEAMNNYSLVTVVYYGQPLTVFQKPFKGLIHISDYVRTDALLRLGGIYLDWDAFWLKPVDDLLTLGYETIAAFDHFFGMGTRKDFPDIINSGVVLARPGSRFIALWQESFRKYTGEDPTFHTIEMVYKLYEEHPNLLYIERRLQVMCFNLRCHPLWLPNFRNEKIHNEFDFTKDAYAVHFTHPLPKSFKSKDEMSKGKDFFANMARHVYGP